VSAEQILGLAGRLALVAAGAAVLLLNVVGLPGNWVLLALAGGYALLTGMERIGWGTLGIIAGLALLAEALELVVGLAYTAKRGATRRGTLGAFVGGLAGAILTASVAPPLGPMLGAFGGTFAGAFLFEYAGERRHEDALRAGRAAFVGRVLAAGVKFTCGFWMWALFAYRLFFRG
jgi:uncharacterized protein YqgC (DUF456 family)